MTRFEKWLAQQDEGKRAEMVCDMSKCSSIRCPLWKPCKVLEPYYKDEEWAKVCEAYLDEEVDDEESPKRTD